MVIMIEYTQSENIQSFSIYFHLHNENLIVIKSVYLSI